MAARKAARPRQRLARAEREQQLLDVAERLFVDRGYDRTSIEDVARAAGITRPVVYHHHGSKEGLYAACVRRARDRLGQEMVAALRGVSEPRERLRVAGVTFFSMLERDPQRWIVLFGGSGAPLTGEVGERLTELRFEMVARLADVLELAARPGVARERVEAAAHAIGGIGEQLGRWWLENPKIPRSRVVEHYTELIWNGVAPFAKPAR